MERTYFEEGFAVKEAGETFSSGDPYQEALAEVRHQLTSAFPPDQLGAAGPRVTDEATRLASQVYISFNDQALRYSTGDLREVYFYRGQLDGHIEREYRPGG